MTTRAYGGASVRGGDTVRRYVQEHAAPAELPGMPPTKFDGTTELWFDDVAALGRCFSDPEYLARIRPDEASFLDLHACDFIVSTENVVFVGPSSQSTHL